MQFRAKTFVFLKDEQEIAHDLQIIKMANMAEYWKIIDVGDKITAFVLKGNSEGLMNYVNRNLEYVQWLKSEIIRAFYLGLREK